MENWGQPQSLWLFHPFWGLISAVYTLTAGELMLCIRLFNETLAGPDLMQLTLLHWACLCIVVSHNNHLGGATDIGATGLGFN